MANQSIYSAFERMWQHVSAKLNTKVTQYAQAEEPVNAVDGDFWIDTNEDSITQKKVYEQPFMPAEGKDGEFWIDTSDLI
jgi:hypothetical protein